VHSRGDGVLKWGFILPALALLLAFNIFPLVFNVAVSFTNMELTDDFFAFQWQWVGGENYRDVFGDAPYGASLRTTALFVFLAVGVELVLGFVVALALHENFAGKPAVLTILLIPMMLSPAVMGLFWYMILNGHYGILNQLLGAAGFPQPQWLTHTPLKLVSILIIDVWMWTPFMMLISLAALNSIPKYIYEAAEIDRAGRWTVFRRITLPMCAPLLFLAVLLRTTDALKQFDLVMALTGPNDAATQTLSAQMYQTAFSSRKVGLGSAYGFVILIAVIALATVFTRYIGYIQRKQGRAAA
jgi:multiple sugar transport system permease protein